MARRRPPALLVSENATKKLTDRGLWQLLAEFDGFGGLIGGEPLLAEVQYLPLRRRGAGPRHDEGLDGLTAVLVLDTDGYGFGNVLVLEEDLFDLVRVDVIA